MNRFLNHLDHQHKQRMVLCQKMKPCLKDHTHSVACYDARTVFEALLEFLTWR